MSTHPTEESLAAFSDGRLGGEERLRIIGHLADCAECRDIVVLLDEIKRAGIVETMVETPAETIVNPTAETEPSSNVVPFPSRMKWLAVAALAAGIVVVFSMEPVREPIRYQLTGGMSEVAKAYQGQPNRRIGGRLSGLPHKPPAQRNRGPETDETLAKTELELAYGRLGEDKDRSWRKERALGMAALMAGKRDEAIEALERARSMRPDDPQVLNDLAAAYLEAHNFSREGAAEQALKTIERAWQLQKTPEIAFNRALALESFRETRKQDALKAWEDYLALDSTSEWAAEAKAHKADLESPY